MKKKNKENKVKKFIKDNSLEIIQAIGFILISIASISINFTFGLYVIGAILVIMSFYLAKVVNK